MIKLEGVYLLDGWKHSPWSENRDTARAISQLSRVGVQGFILNAPSAPLNRNLTWAATEARTFVWARGLVGESTLNIGGTIWLPASATPEARSDRNLLREAVDYAQRFLGAPLVIRFAISGVPTDSDLDAEFQSEICNRIGEARANNPTLVCPVVYSEQIPRGLALSQIVEYWSKLGRRMDPRVGALWTGIDVMSTKISGDALRRADEILGRRVAIWSNQVANDKGTRVPLELLEMPHWVSQMTDRTILLNIARQPRVSVIAALRMASYVNLGESYVFDYSLLEPYLAPAMTAWLTEFSEGERVSATLMAALRDLAAGGDPTARELLDLGSR